jgi:Universal stress protein family.
MPEPQQKIVACVDRSRYSTEVADGATWAAQHLHAPLEFLHVIDRTSPSGGRADHSGAIGFDAQEHLLQTLAEEDAARAREAREQGRECLSRLRQRAVAAGIERVDMRLRHGDLRETLVEQQREHACSCSVGAAARPKSPTAISAAIWKSWSALCSGRSSSSATPSARRVAP